MDNQFIEARELLIRARESLRHGDKASARQLGGRAARLAPQMEDVWLVLAAADPNPQHALAYARKALQINSHSTRAHRAVEWASGRLRQPEIRPEPGRRTPAVHPSAPLVHHPTEVVASLPSKHAYQSVVPMPALRVQGRNWLLPALFFGAGILFIGFIFLFVVARPALASIVRDIGVPAPTQENLWAPADIVKPEVTPINVSASAPLGAHTPVPTSVPTLRATSTNPPASEPTKPPTDVPTEAPTIIPAATETPGVVAMELIDDPPTSEYKPPKPEEVVGNGVRWIDVDLTNQMVYAYEGDVIVNSFLVSTGTWLTPTVTGEYKIYVKYRSGSMSGPGYFLPHVPYIMYFYKSYGLHGTYWHNNFGTPMSHGCVNLRTDDAAWLFDWASVGTVVNVHY
jgi:lipoprotein-anchoring transpeptidase ErfK/SrfK